MGINIGNLSNLTLKVGSADCKVYLGSVQVYPNSTPIVVDDYLTFVAREDGTFKLTNRYIDYSLDSGSTWTTLPSNTNTPTVQSGHTIMWRGYEYQPTIQEGIGTFSSSGEFDVEGNIMSVYGDDFIDSTSLSGKEYAFLQLFKGCTNLVSAEKLKLPATELSSMCYYHMFMNCTSLTTAPSVLPTSTLANSCYRGMFQGCSSLTEAPILSESIMDGQYCYADMFLGCSSLTKAPKLSNTSLGYACYYDMFASCTSLTEAPELPATTLAINCYTYMFNNCTSLTTAPELIATTLSDNCYANMFNGCSNLNYIKCLATDISASNCTQNWVKNVSANGTFIKSASMNGWSVGNNGIPNGWTVMDDYLRFTAKEDGTFKFSGNSIDYSIDNGSTWTTLASNTDTPTIQSGSTILWKATLTPTSSIGIGRFSSSGAFDVEGNAMSLLYGSDFEGQTSLSGKTNAFFALFSGCTHLESAERMKLPATALANNCYLSMFRDCSSLTKAPQLPSTTLANNCYQRMFQGCSSLTKAPKLEATSLGYSSYGQMFYGCTSLTVAPQLPSTAVTNDCYGQMFYGCTALTESPILRAETLRNGCYAQMFRGCSSLNKITCLATNISATNCTTNWSDGVAANGTFVKASSMSSWTSGVSGIPNGWSTQNYS